MHRQHLVRSEQISIICWCKCSKLTDFPPYMIERGGGGTTWEINNGQKVMIDGWKVDKKRQRGQHVYQTAVCLSPEPRSQKATRTKRALPTEREKDEERRERERREEEEKLKTVEGGSGKGIKARHGGDWRCSLKEDGAGSKRGMWERETCWPLLNLWIQLSWTQDSHHMSDYHLSACVCVGWMDMCVGGCVPCVVLCGLINNVMRTVMCGLELKGHNAR